VNNADVIDRDTFATNGVIHIIDEVLLPPKNLVETAAGNKWLSTLVAAVEAAGLTETLANGGPFTIFAPTNRAFDHLPEGTLEALLADPDALAEILKYHVVPGTITSEDLEDGAKVTTLQGGTVKISLKRHWIGVNDAEVIDKDVFASNGMIHIIDEVLLP
jgi:transforming growth factor-beta-induced protein